MTDDDWQCLFFELGVSIRYHAHRAAFFRLLDTTNGVLSLFAGSAAAASAMSDHPLAATAFGAAIALSNAVNVMAGSARKMGAHRGLRARFIALEKEMKVSEPSEAVYRHILNDRASLEAEEPESLGALYALAYNEQLRALGIKDGYAKRPWYQRILKNVWDFESQLDATT